MAAKKIIAQPDILDLESLGAFMDAQQDPVGKSPSEAAPQVLPETRPTEEESHPKIKEKTQTKTKDVSGKTRQRIDKHEGNDEWSSVLRYAGYYNDNSTAGKTTVAMNSDIKTVLEIIHNSYRGEINCGNLIDAICRAFIERNKDKILELLVFGSYIESVEFREAMVKLVAYAVVFAIGYHLNLVFGDDRIAPLLDGYAMTSLFAGLQFLSGAMDRTILVGGCLVVLFSLVLKLVISLVVGAIILPFSVTYNIYKVLKNGYLLVKYGIDG